MTDYSELIERLEDQAHMTQRDGLAAMLATATEAATAIRDLIAERDAAHAKGWNEAIEAAAKVAYVTCAQTRHVTLGDACDAAIRAMRKDAPSHPGMVVLNTGSSLGVSHNDAPTSYVAVSYGLQEPSMKTHHSVRVEKDTPQ